MTRPDDRVETLAQDRLAVEERRLARRNTVGLGATFAEFWRHPSPWIIAAALVATLVWRVAEGGWRLGDRWGPLVLVALFPVIEWVIHVFVLHWRPRRIAGLHLDTEVARDHRRHHADPRDVPLVFVPWRTLVGLIVGYDAIALLAFPRLGQALSFMLCSTAVLFLYEWTHYLIHSDYKPRSRAYRAIWRNHRLHHYKNEHYWFTVTTTATADKLFGTYPDPADVPTSPTAKGLHGTG
jgi:sterol desaturase/sphingolipid hydroxylase (fatty acid hydroxylase superfamily)